jgi:hypothetical protein
MVASSGSFAGRARLQTTLGSSDGANHELNAVEVAGPQHSTDARWNDARITYWGTADLVAGSGRREGTG